MLALSCGAWRLGGTHRLPGSFLLWTLSFSFLPREEEEDKMLETMIKKKDFQREAESDSKKKGKFKTIKVLKFLGNKREAKSKAPGDKS